MLRRDPFDDLVFEASQLIAMADLLGTNLTGSVNLLRAALQRYEAYRAQCLHALNPEESP